jgi:hypothetical protein
MSRITFKEEPTSNSLATIGRRLHPLVSQATTCEKLQLHNSLDTTRRRLQPPMFSRYNQKVDTTTYPYLVKLPLNISRIMEPLSHYHCDIYYCKPVPINLHQKTYNNLYKATCNQPIPITCKQPVPINHATCTMHQPVPRNL